MTYRTSRDVFDSTRFRADVTAYMDRWHLTTSALCAGANISTTAVYEFLRGDHEPSLLLVCILADICDLNLDNYCILADICDLNLDNYRRDPGGEQ